MSERRGEEVGQVDHQPDRRELEEAENESQEQGSAPRFDASSSRLSIGVEDDEGWLWDGSLILGSSWFGGKGPV